MNQPLFPSLILRAATTALAPLMFLFSLFFLIRGHNLPGGGFIGGLVAGSALSLVMFAYGIRHTRRLLFVPDAVVIAIGLGIAVASSLVALFQGHPWMKGLWPDLVLPIVGKLGTPVIFDMGVYVLVFGMIMRCVDSLASLASAREELSESRREGGHSL